MTLHYQTLAENPLVEPSPYAADGGELIGRHPDDVGVAEWLACREHFDIGLKAVRRNCLECAGDSPAEVRKCVMTPCAFWPIRLGRVPAAFREARMVAGGR